MSENAMKILLSEDDMFQNSNVCIQDLLHKTKSKIDTKRARWDAMKRAANPYEAVSQHNMIELEGSRPVSRSFFKMWEMLHEFPELKGMLNGRVACVAEGPGGFVQAILRAKPCHVDVVTLVSRQSPCMRVYDSNVAEHTIDGTGDVCKLVVARGFVNVSRGASLFTADGGFDMNGRFDEQESLSLPLIEAEVCIGITTLMTGGCMVIKFYDVFVDGTKALIEWMYGSFEQVYIYKPCTSRPANSERYVVCLKKRDTQIVRDIHAFVMENGSRPQYRSSKLTTVLNNINCILGKRQLRSINRSLSMAPIVDEKENVLHVLQWCQKYNMKINKNAILHLKHDLKRPDQHTSCVIRQTSPKGRTEDAGHYRAKRP
jgi:23S rRNA U2552 (ribose-2'-O)-methylase RlmE/FtsJ